MQHEINETRENPADARPSIAWDTSSTVLDVAIRHGERIERIHEQAGRRHNEMLACAIDTLLDRMNLTAADLSSVACCRGPGSFTGLRIGIATAKGLVAGVGTSFQGSRTASEAAWESPRQESTPSHPQAHTVRTAHALRPSEAVAPRIVGVPTLMAYAYAVATDGVVLAAIDGRKERFYAALYRRRTLLWGPADATPEAVCRAIATHVRQHETVTMVGPDNAMLLEKLEASARLSTDDATTEIPGRLRPDRHYESGIATTLIEIADEDMEGRMRLAPDEGPDYLRVSQAEE